MQNCIHCKVKIRESILSVLYVQVYWRIRVILRRMYFLTSLLFIRSSTFSSAYLF